MIVLLVKMALYIIVSVLFGYIVGVLYSNAKNRESNIEKEQKHYKILSEKNGTIVKLKNDLRSTRRNIDAINQGYELQSKLLITKDRELKDALEEAKDHDSLKIEHRAISIQLTDKIKIVDDKDEIITLLEKKIRQISKENA